jgi:type I restriction enzyme S subunit
MTAELKKIFESKRATRRELASKPIGEKLRIVEELTERALLTRKDTAGPLPDEPWEIPTTWRWKRMGDVARIVGGGTPRTDRSEYFGGDVPWITPADLSGYTQKTISRGFRSITDEGLANSAAQLLPTGTVLFSSRAPIGYVAIAANPVTTNQGFKSFVLGEELEPDFIYYYLQHARGLAIALASGTTFLEVSGKNAARIPVPLPSIQEQRRIVAEIEKQITRLDAGIASLKHAKRKLKRYRAAVLYAACDGRLTRSSQDSESQIYEAPQQLLARILAERRSVANFRSKYKEPKAVDCTRLPFLPPAWTWASIEQISTRVVDGVHKKPTYVPTGIPFVTVRNLTAGSNISFEKLNYISGADHAEFTKRANPEFGDLLVSKDGTLGVVRVVNTDIPFSIFVSVALIKPVLREMSSYLRIALESPQVQAQMVPKGSGLQHIHLEDLREDCIPLPPLAEQRRIVAEVERRLSVIGSLEKIVDSNLKRAARLRQSILERAFSGRLLKSNVTEKSAAKAKEMSPASRRHFLRAVLSAEIVHQLHAEPTFGQTKHQKIFHLCEHIARLTELDVQYHRDAAGPYDNRLIYANEAELKKQKWYESYSRKKVGHAYRPLAKAGGHEKYLERYWPEKIETVRRLIHRMRDWDTEQCEIFSTAYAAWNDLILWGHEVTDDAILHEVLHRWHPSKQRIPKERWRTALEWMRRKGFAPTGFGKPTAAPPS